MGPTGPSRGSPAAPSRGVEEKLAAIRRGARESFPTADIETMLAETERGYRSGP
jgi:hypothetical protein